MVYTGSVGQSHPPLGNSSAVADGRFVDRTWVLLVGRLAGLFVFVEVDVLFVGEVSLPNGSVVDFSFLRVVSI